MADKIRPHHLERKAILYVRQSSAHQVLHNRESSALQYAMRDRLVGLGWSHIETIDDDLGRSAAGGVARAPDHCAVGRSTMARGTVSRAFRANPGHAAGVVRPAPAAAFEDAPIR